MKIVKELGGTGFALAVSAGDMSEREIRETVAELSEPAPDSFRAERSRRLGMFKNLIDSDRTSKRRLRPFLDPGKENPNV
jgi:hypothetical protein